MISTISISNLALIEKLEIPFYSGLHVLSGETGAGKSIVVDAVMVILGERADRSLVRTGSEKAAVEAIFDLTECDWIEKYLQDNGIESDPSAVSLYREINIKGGGQCRICGVPVTLSKLRELSSMLMDIHGQDQHRFLTDTDMQRSYIDDLGNENHHKLRKKVATACSEFIECHREYARLVRLNETHDKLMEDIKKKLELLKSVDLENDSEDNLREQIEKMRLSEKTLETITAARNCLSGFDGEENTLSSLKSLLGYMDTLKTIDAHYSEMHRSAESAYYALDEISYTLSRTLEEAEGSLNAKEDIEDKLDQMVRIRKLFGTDLSEIIKTKVRLEQQYEELLSLDGRIAEISSEHKRLLSIYRSLAKELTESRKNIADRFAARIMEELAEVGMEKTVISVDFKQKSDTKPTMPTMSGDDTVEFLISTNPGEPLKPLAKIASGGELSRIMLAIKSLESEHSGVMTMVFDEIDTGISGRVAQAVAEKMKKISNHRQVICVTHLPQIAAQADHQYLVEKNTYHGRTTTDVSELDINGRIHDIARLISGSGGITDESIEYASSMLAKK